MSTQKLMENKNYSPNSCLMNEEFINKIVKIAKHDKNAVWVVEGGYTALSERKVSDKYIPSFGKITWENKGKVRLPGKGVTVTEQNCFSDMLALKYFLHKLGVQHVIPILTFSDNHWYKLIQGEEKTIQNDPVTRKKNLLQKIIDQKRDFFPDEYLAIISDISSQFHISFDKIYNEIIISLQHEYSSKLKRTINNYIMPLKRKRKKNSTDFDEYLGEYHKRIFLLRRGMLLLDGYSSNQQFSLFSPPSLRQKQFAHDDILTKTTKKEGAIGISATISKNSQILHQEQLCGAVSAGELLWMANIARKSLNLQPEHQIITINIHDLSDDINIGQKFSRGIYGAYDATPDNNRHLLLVKDNREITFVDSGNKSEWKLHDGEILFDLLGLTEKKIDSKMLMKPKRRLLLNKLLKSDILQKTFELELDLARSRIEQSMSINDLYLRYTNVDIEDNDSKTNNYAENVSNCDGLSCS